MRATTVLLLCVILVLLGGAMLGGLKDFRSTTVSNSFDVTTAGDNSTVLTLSLPILDDDSTNTVISSNMTADAPLITGYTPSSKKLAVSGLDAGTTLRRLTVAYRVNQLGSFVGVDLASKLWPTFFMLSLIGIVAAALIYQFRGGD